MRLLTLLPVMLGSIVLQTVGCGTSDAPPDTSASASSPAPPAAPEARRYGVRSGMYTATTRTLGTTTVTTWFDGWGAVEAIHTTTEVEVMGTRSVSRSVEIVAGGWRTRYDPDTRTGERWRVSGGSPGASLIPDIGTLTDALRTEYELTELEARTYFGREARGFAMNLAGMRVRTWIWENIPSRTEMDMGGGEPMVTEVVDVQLDVPVPAERFQVPADVSVSEVVG